MVFSERKGGFDIVFTVATFVLCNVGTESSMSAYFLRV